MMTSKSEQFISDLAQFNRNRGHQTLSNPANLITRLNGRIIDLWQLYNYVLERGGSYKVNQANQWDEIYCKLFKASSSGANVAVALRQIYSRFLLPYERVFSPNLGNDLLDDEEEESFSNTSNFSSSFLFHSAYSFSSSTNAKQEKTNPFNKLFCSFLSGLPNEIDFSLRIATILANAHQFDWLSDSKFIDILLESCPNYCCVCHEEEGRGVLNGRELLVDNAISELDILGENECSKSRAVGLTSGRSEDTCQCHCYERFWMQTSGNEHLLALIGFDLQLGYHELAPQLCQIIQRRIKLVAELIRNLSFSFEDQQHEFNQMIATSAGTTHMLKFVSLLMTCEDTLLNQIGLDILSNIAIATTPIQDELYYQLQQFIYRHCILTVIESNDAFCLTRSLQVISKLLYSGNDDVIVSVTGNLFELEIYERIIQLLTCQNDVQLLVSTLELCLAFSEQKPQLLLKENNNHLIKILLNLINIEASNHFTSSSLQKIEIIDERQQKSVLVSGTTSHTPLSNSNNVTLNVQLQPQHLPPQNVLHQSNDQSDAISNESFATNWLKSTYEPSISSQSQNVKISDLFADYVKQCCRAGRRNVVAAQPFTQLVKRCFPSCNMTNNGMIIEGISLKNVISSSLPTLTLSSSPVPTSTSTTTTPLLASPILKAHLSAPPKNNSPTHKSSSDSSNASKINLNMTSNSTTSASSSTPSITTSNTSTLIKSLLANKLRSNAVTSALTSNVTTSTSTVACKPIASSASCANTSTISVITTLSSALSSSSPISIPISCPSTSTTVLTSTLNSLNEMSNSNSVSAIESPVPAQSQMPTQIVVNTTQQPQMSHTLVTQHANSNTSTPLNITLSSPNYVIASSNNSFTSQAPQQFLLVRTIITNNQQQGSNMPGSLPVRLIVPANMLQQVHRPNLTLGSASTNANVVNGVSFTTNNSLSNTNTTHTLTIANTTSSCSTSDLFLKTVLSNSNSNSSNQSLQTVNAVRNPVKSSPLLNVLLDKGRLPDLNSNNSLNVNMVNNMNMTKTSNNSSNSPVQLQTQPKMFILTTKSPMTIKNATNLQSCQQPITLHNPIQNIPTIHIPEPETTSTPKQSQQQIVHVNQNCVSFQMPLKTQDIVCSKPITKINGEVDVTDNLTLVNNNNCNQIILKPNIVSNACNKSLSTTNISVNASNTNNSVIINNNNSNNNNSNVTSNNCTKTATSGDLSSIKDIKKAMDDATKLIQNKRTKQQQQDEIANKKLKTDAQQTSLTNNINMNTSISTSKPNTSISSTNTNTCIMTATTCITTTTTNALTPSSPSTSHLSLSSNPSTSTCVIKKQEYECSWHECNKTFTRPSQVFLHVYEVHVMPKTFPNMMTCYWGGMQGVGPGCVSKRPKLSLLTHILDFHCNPNILHQTMIRKQQLGTNSSKSNANPVVTVHTPPAHPGYAHNAAYLAIRRHAINYAEPPSQPPIAKTAPISISIRLTAALILRNLAEHSHFVKRTLNTYEPVLSELCMSEGRDESRTIAQLLLVIKDRQIAS